MKTYRIAVDCLYEIKAESKRKAMSMAKEMARECVSGMWSDQGGGLWKKILGARDASSPQPTIQDQPNESP